VTVALEATEDRLIVEVVDDGLGLPLGTSVEGQGMRSMRRRAFVMGGTVEIRNRRRGGVVVRCTVPIPKPTNALDD
jgi:signal transduction histidine kinase